MRVFAATMTTATMNTIDRSSMPTQRSAIQLTATASSEATVANTRSSRDSQWPGLRQRRRARARASGELMMTSS